MWTTDPQPLAFAIVGLVESTTGRWLDQPGSTAQDRLVADLVRWIWLLVDDTLRGGGGVRGQCRAATHPRCDRGAGWRSTEIRNGWASPEIGALRVRFR